MTSHQWNAAFQWQRCPEAEAFCLQLLEDACRLNPFLASLQKELFDKTSTRLFDWVDHFSMGFSSEHEQKLQESGFTLESASSNYRVFIHPGAQLPRVVMRDQAQMHLGVAVVVESIADFLMMRGMSARIEGTPFSCYRRCIVSNENEVICWVVERRVGGSMEPAYPDENSIGCYYQAKELWQTRLRSSRENEDEQMQQALAIASELISLVGRDMASWIAMECERDYWQGRNLAAQVQKNRQDRLGMGWANHDHHTFRSSRRHFGQLVRLFEMLGFSCRERFWAGSEAGWGAQVMENPRSKLVLFLDVDLLPSEIEIDFSHQPLPETTHLGTVGLWCALHGDSILRSGMHHLEAQFLFENLTADLAQVGVKMMKPFSNFDYLKQAFTSAEIWPVQEVQIDKLVSEGKITSDQGCKFKTEGSVGSHLENLQRRDGYKGFNQKNVSFIIEATDPRKASVNG